MIKDVYTFFSFAQNYAQGTHESIVAAVCVHAMEQHKLHVCATNSIGLFLWDAYSMTLLQWQSVYNILRQKGIGTSVFWHTGSTAYRTPLLADLDCVWEDMDCIEEFIASIQGTKTRALISWIPCQLARRQGWTNGLRRAWLAAVLGR
jgi:hypothetical protein